MLRSLRSRAASLVAIALVSTALPGAAASASAPATSHGPAFIERSVREAEGLTSALVHVRGERSLDEGVSAARAAGADIGTAYEAINVFVAYGTSSTFDRIARSSAIEGIEANARLQHFTNTSHKATRGQDVLDGAVMTANGSRIDGSGVGVAVVDSGIDGSHPDFAGRMGGNVKIVCTTPQFVALGANGGFTQCLGPKAAVPLTDTDTPSGGGHGTHVAGIVAGSGAASGGTYHGAAPGATLYGVSVGTVISVENGLDGLDWVLQNHDQVTPAIRVVNNSWGSSYANYDPANAPFHKALWLLQEALVADGVSVVFAAGNSSGDGSASTTSGECNNPTPGVLCVANYNDSNSGTRNGTISASSSRGKSNVPLEWPDISAPGTNIISTCRVTLPVCTYASGAITNENSYRSLSGTSMAAPHIAGIVAQLYQADPELTPAEVESYLEDNAYKFQFGSAYGLFTDPTNPDNSSSFEKGHGLVDVVATLNAILSSGGGDPTPTPTPTGTPTATPTPDPTPTEPVGGGAAYYFHSASGLNNQDQAIGTKPSFNTVAPTETAYSFALDVPGALSTASTGAVDPIWHGDLATQASSLSVDFWQRTLPSEALGAANYNVRVFAGGTYYDLFPLIKRTDLPLGSNDFIRLQHTFTKMNPAPATETDPAKMPALSLPTGPISIAIRGFFTVNEAVTEIRFDSTTYPSGFSVNGGGSGPTASPTPTPTATTSPTASPSASPTTQPPTGSFAYANYQPTNGLGAGAAEPTIGVNPATGATFFQAGIETLKVDFNAGGTPTWADTGAPLTSITTLDPILWTDPETGRTFVSQLAAGCSLMAYTDDDGATWTENPIGCGIASGIDHQTVSGGNFAADPPLQSIDSEYPNAVYYCSHASVDATCEISIDGGDTFTPANPIYTALDCFGLHGHLSVAPDGTLYVPNFDCGGKVATVVSEDNGLTWDIRTVPTSTTQDESDPSAAVNPDGTVYLGWEEGANNATGSKAFVGVSDDKGLSWQHVQNVAPQINNVQFPAMVAGSDGRAALTFLGTTTAGNDQAAGFQGVWHLYISTTLDGGKTWTTVNATPNDPVQRGCIWLAGGSNACRNLLDFIDITIDEDGRVLAAYADGCVSAACIGSGGTPAMSRAELASIARQVGGPRLLASATDPDPTESPSASASPSTSPTTQPPQGVIFEDEGRIETSNPASLTGAGITQNEFLFWCDGEAPFSQGLDGYVFELPEAISEDATATLVGSESLMDDHDLDMYFFDEECADLGAKNTADPDETSPVPAGTKYVIANAFFGIETLATLTVTGGAVDPTTSPTASPTVSASPSASPSDPGPGGVRGTYPATPNDPYFGVDPTGPTDFRPTQWGLRKVLAPQAWQLATGFGIRVGVIDSGVDLQHEDLQCPGKLEVNAGSDVVSNDSNPDDEFGHGTHVAGIIAACTDNGTGVAGIAPDATIVPIRVLNAAGSGNDAQLIAGLDKARQLGVHVINMSLGYQPGKQVINDVGAIDQAIERAREAGIVIVAAAGNDSSPLCDYPALAADIICVGATDIRDLKAAYSTFPNKLNGTDFGNGMVAPGGSSEPFCDSYAENILSTVPVEKDTDGCTDIQGYQVNSGTSMASPHVAGVAALVYDRLGGTVSTANAQTVIDTLLSTTEDLGTPGYDPVFGYGRLDAQAAVAAITPPIEMVVTEIEFGPDSAQSTQYSDDATFSAVLTDETGAAMADAELEFELTGADESRTWTATTDASGLASDTQTITDEPGAYSLSVRFAGDSTYEASAGQMGFVVDKEATATALTLNRQGSPRVLTATVTDADSPTSGIAGRTVRFFAGDIHIGEAETDVDGIARFEAPAPYDRGRYVYTAVAPESPRFLRSDSSPSDPTPPLTTITYTGAASGRFGDEVSLQARLVDQDGTPVAGASVVLELTGADYSKSWDLLTDNTGVAARSVTLDGAPGPYSITVRYDGRFDTYEPSATTAGFVIDKEITSQELLVSGKPSKRTLETRLTDDEGNPIAGALITFFADGQEIGTATTGSDGRASISTGKPGKGSGIEFESRYGGNDRHLSSTGRRTV